MVTTDDLFEVFGNNRGSQGLSSIWNIARRDVEIPLGSPTELLRDKHVDFIVKSGANTEGYEYILTEYLRVSGIYWCVGSLDLANQLEKQDQKHIENIIKIITDSKNEDGGYGSAKGHDSQILHTLCALQVFIILKRLDLVDKNSVVSFIQNLQNEDGSFCGESRNKEVDTRFTFCALLSLYLIDRLDAVDVRKAVDFVFKCYNFDGGFGTRPGSESHSGQVYCCVGTLALTGCLEQINMDRTAQWLADRQCRSGGLCGRPEKLPDVCYSWWVLASLAMLGKLDYIDKEDLTKFILAAQDDETGGIADRPGDMPDPFHTIFGLAGLSLLGYPGLEPVDPIFCMTKRSLGELSFM
ncbi:unnamed protein product [Bursaphelenchus okinawaensis]|uniref:Geranylgeranyl transferase type-2 subunit beta n=1 Tax=Bursaphelenchus okinawaensis TaxID=465554 RepID=A0A811LNH0_9BILA|nr:unnamed protein product [Bursaphelenchus okinawaensis]CAG9125432.1 unnamed protein product [Bursaphelenchus okinawaensis]